MERKVLSMHNEPLLEIDKLRASIASKIHYLKENNSIAPELYAQYDIKRGLRNANGTGVLVGITRISEVRGYTVENGKKIPCEGQLMYRGIPITDLVGGFERENRLGFEEVVHLLLFGSARSSTGSAAPCSAAAPSRIISRKISSCAFQAETS